MIGFGLLLDYLLLKLEVSEMNRRNFLAYCGTLVSLNAISKLSWASSLAANSARKNVLFIAVDDLRTALGCYGDASAITPNIDKLAGRGVLFQSAYCQVAVCNPSRASLLTGARPDTIKVWDLEAHFRGSVPSIVTLPQHFKNNGYVTRSIGKIFHEVGRSAKDPVSWSVPPLYDCITKRDNYVLAENRTDNPKKKMSAAECADVPDDAYVDGKVCNDAITALGEYAKSKTAFFLGVGFRKPHLPFSAPKKYWDMYGEGKILAAESSEFPAGAPELALRSPLELQGYKDVEDEDTISAEQTKYLRHAYYACVSYTDALVGKVMDELDRLKLSDNTVVVLWGDHGFHLSEQGLWAKSRNYELDTHAPLIIVDAGRKANGKKCEALVEFVDIYPTLTEVCNLDSPKHLEGLSMAALLDEPNLLWKKAAFSQFARNKTKSRNKSHGDIMGRAIRTKHFRYVEWRQWDDNKLLATELYDHQRDNREMSNIADKAEYARTVQELSELLQKGWQGALPE